MSVVLPPGEFLLRLASPDPAARVILADTTTDWARLLELAAFHGLRPLLRDRLPDALPAAARMALNAAVADNIARGLFLCGELVKITDAFAASSLPFVPFKGPVLARQLLGQTTSREFADLDLLIRRADLPAAAAVLGELGYRPETPPPARHRRLWERWQNELMYTRPGTPGCVELHWQIAPPFLPLTVDVGQLIETAVPAPFENRTIRQLPPPSLLVLLCVHGARHAWNALGWLADVAALIRTFPAADWDAADHTARSWHARRMLALGLQLVTAIPGVVLPPPAVALAGAAPPAPVAERIRAGWLAGQPLPPRRELYRSFAVCLDSAADRARLYARLVCQPTAADLQWVSLPEWLGWLYPAVRPLRLLVSPAPD